jgi:ribose-phosphate pyrophosphokinase
MAGSTRYWLSLAKVCAIRRSVRNGSKVARITTLSTSSSQSSSYGDQSKWMHISAIAATTTLIATCTVDTWNSEPCISGRTDQMQRGDDPVTLNSTITNVSNIITSCDDGSAFRSFRDYRFHEGEDEEEQVHVKVVYRPKDKQDGEEVSFSCSHRDHLKSVNALKNAMELIMEEQCRRHQQELNGEEIMATSTPITNVDAQRPIQLDRNCVHTKKMYFYAAPKVTPQLAARTLLISGPSSVTLSTDVAQLLGLELNAASVGSFSDGETAISLEDSVRAKNCFIITSTRTADHIMQLLLLISTLRRASAKTITAVIPYYGYSRQDRRLSREPIAAADLARALEAMGVDNVFCLDLHSDSLVGFFEPKTTVEHLVPVPVAAAYFNEEFIAMADALHVANPKGKWEYPKVTVVASHEGHMERAVDFQYALQRLSGQEVQVALISKGRNARGEKRYEPSLVGDVKGRVCVVVSLISFYACC